MPRKEHTNHRKPVSAEDRTKRAGGQWNFHSIQDALVLGGHSLHASGYRQALFHILVSGMRRIIHLPMAHRGNELWTSQKFVKWCKDEGVKVELNGDGKETIVQK